MLGCRLWAWEEGPAHLCVTLLREGVEAPGDPHGAGVKAAPRLEALVTVTPGKPQSFLEHRRGLQGDPGSDPHLPPHPPPALRDRVWTPSVPRPLHEMQGLSQPCLTGLCRKCLIHKI